MKLHDLAILPLLVFLAFGYSVSVVDRATDHGDVKLTKAAAVAEVKADIAKFKPSTKFVINQ